MGEPVNDVLILGGGVIGLACAHYLLQAGRSVHVLERGRVGGATSHGNCGTLTPSHAPPLASPASLAKGLRWMLRPDAPLYIRPRLDLGLANWLLHFAGRCNARDWRRSAESKGRLLATSRQLIEDLVRDHALDCEFHASGLRYIYAGEKAMRADLEALPQLVELGIAADVLDAKTLEANEPALRTGLAGGLHFPGDAQLRPDAFTRELARIVREAGGTIEEGVEVRDLGAADAGVRTVDTSHGKRSGRDVLLALGPWSAPLAARAGLRLPVQPGKGYSITYSRPALAPRVPMVLRERSVCVTAWDNGFRLGSTMEFSGYDARMNRVRLDALERGAAEYLREPTGPEKREEWFGWRPMTWDDLPILGRAPRQTKLWLATGHGMMGIGMSAGSGRLLAELITGRDTHIDPAPYAATRF